MSSWRPERIKYAIRLPANQILQHRIGYLLKRQALQAIRNAEAIVGAVRRFQAAQSRAKVSRE